MRNSLHLATGPGDDQHGRVALSHRSRDAARAFQGVDHIADSYPLYRFSAAVRHPHKRAGPDAFMVVVDALLLLFVPFVLQASEFDSASHAIRIIERPARCLAAVPVAAAQRRRDVLNELARGHLFLANDQCPSTRGHSQSRHQRRLAAAGRAAVADYVGLAIVGEHLRTWRGVE